MRDIIFEVSFLGQNTVELARGDTAALLAGLRSQIMLDAIVVKSVLGVLVGISAFLPHAITLLRSFHLGGFVGRLMSLSIVRCSALDMRLE